VNAEQLALAERVLEQVTRHTETHDQASYGTKGRECGTVACIAGWAVILSPTPGVVPNWRGLHGIEHLSGVFMPDEYPPDYATYEDGSWMTHAAAQALLGLDHTDAVNLFDGDRTEADAVELLQRIIADARAELAAAEVTG
jgi:hypothetical protein